MANTYFKFVLLLALIVCAMLTGILVLTRGGKSLNSVPFRTARMEIAKHKPSVTVGVAVCGDRLIQSIVMLKSLIIFSRNVNLTVIAFQDSSTSSDLLQEVEALQESASLAGVNFNFQIYDSWFPEAETDSWRNWFAPCSTQRLFYPSLLPHVDKILHLDSDVLLLTDILDVWNHFEEMDRHGRIAAMAPEHIPPGYGWYDMKAKIPYYGPRGLNAGVMLMNLEAMRKVDFQNGVLLVYKRFRGHLVWADQDLLNVYFYFYENWMHELPCDMNYMVQFCQADQFNKIGLAANCTRAEKNGISILHGNRHRFDNFNMTHNMFVAFQEYRLDMDTPEKLLGRLYVEHLDYKETGKPCSYLSTDIFKNFQRYLRPFRVSGQNNQSSYDSSSK